MPRAARIQVAGATYHVTARGNGGATIFADDFDRLRFLALLARVTRQHGWRCLAYCLMQNHYHLLVSTPEPNLSSGMRLVQTRYAREFNRRHGRTGHVFGDRFHDRRIDVDSHLLAAAVYTVLNPVRAGVVAEPHEWPWSSYRASAGLGEPFGPLATDDLLDMLSSDRERAQAMYREMVKEAAGRARSSSVVGENQGDSHLR